MGEVPAINRAGWRLWWTAGIQFIPFVLSVLVYSGINPGCAGLHSVFTDLRSKLAAGGAAALWPRWLRSLPLLAATGAVLAVHFASWSWSVQHTTLTRSLLFVTAHPVVGLACVGVGGGIAVCLKRGMHSEDEPSAHAFSPGGAPPSARLRRACLSCLPRRSLTWQEVGGTAVALLGAALMVLPEELGWGTQPDSGDAGPEPSLAGDAAAFLGAVAMAAYLWVGASARKWAPLWLYAFPVTAFAALTASLASLAIESGVSPLGEGARGWFGWAQSGEFALLAFLSGFISGILGHSLAILSLKYLSPLLVSVALLLEPLLGSFIGWAAGQQGVPTLWTGVGGVVLLLGITMVTLFQSQARSDPVLELAPAGGSRRFLIRTALSAKGAKCHKPAQWRVGGVTSPQSEIQLPTLQTQLI